MLNIVVLNNNVMCVILLCVIILSVIKLYAFNLSVIVLKYQSA